MLVNLLDGVESSLIANSVPGLANLRFQFVLHGLLKLTFFMDLNTLNSMDCTPLNVQNMALQSQNSSLAEGAHGTFVSEQIDHDLLEGAPGPLPDRPEEMNIPLSQKSAGMSITSEQERDLLEPGPTKKTQIRVKLFLSGRKRLKALLAKGILLETARSLAVKPPTASNEG
ncbi:uncharacterized protein LOC119685872 [Teleopsis dalmanni]|uniref:uncharacterized protein LOC119685872 n=1 Tax=Teleopsis dalmanni TaxID=139649 RepID=UPI0018CF7934|nr:uncharacterized protein LOC119685872 [Teleopsis dalmanni]